MLSLLHVSASKRPSSRRLYTKEYKYSIFLLKMCMCRFNIQYYQLKLLSMFEIRINYRCFAFLNHDLSSIADRRLDNIVYIYIAQLQ